MSTRIAPAYGLPGWWGAVDLDDLDAAQVEPGTVAGANEPDLRGVAGRAAQDDPGGVHVSEQLGDPAAVATGGARRHGHGDVEGEQVAHRAGRGVAVQSCVHVNLLSVRTARS